MLGWLLNLGFAGGAAVIIVPGPFFALAGEVYCIGAIEGEAFVIGAVAGESYVIGAVEAEAQPG